MDIQTGIFTQLAEFKELSNCRMQIIGHYIYCYHSSDNVFRYNLLTNQYEVAGTEQFYSLANTASVALGARRIAIKAESDGRAREIYDITPALEEWYIPSGVRIYPHYTYCEGITGEVKFDTTANCLITTVPGKFRMIPNQIMTMVKGNRIVYAKTKVGVPVQKTMVEGLPFRMLKASGVVVGDNIYLFGGKTQNGVTDQNIAYRYDVPTGVFTQLANIPFIAVDTSVVYVPPGKIHLFGSSSTLAGFGDKAHYVYDILTDTYTKLSDMPVSNSGIAAFLYKGKIRLYGGQVNRYKYYEYDILTDTYKALDSITGGTEGPMQNKHVVLGDVLYAMQAYQGNSRMISLKTSSMQPEKIAGTIRDVRGSACFCRGKIRYLGDGGTLGNLYSYSIENWGTYEISAQLGANIYDNFLAAIGNVMFVFGGVDAEKRLIQYRFKPEQLYVSGCVKYKNHIYEGNGFVDIDLYQE